MYASQMQNVLAGRFLYGTGEEHTIHLLLKSKDNIANIFLNNQQTIFGEAFTLAFKNKLYAKRLTVIPSLAVESHLQHGIFQTIHFNLEILFGTVAA